MTALTELFGGASMGRFHGVISPMRHPQNSPQNPMTRWTFGRDSANLGVKKSLWQGARCSQRISALLKPDFFYWRSVGLPPLDNFDGLGIARRVAHGTL
jgi:hypothetical protein